MPTRPKLPCRHPGCRALCEGGRCAAHTVMNRQEHDRRRGTSTERGYDAAWRRVRAERLRLDHHLCQACLRDGRPETAAEVDHIMPIARGGARLDLDNLQSLCHACHSRKTATQDGGLGNQPRRPQAPDVRG